MSKTEDEKLAALLEKELDSLLARTPDKGTEPELEPDRVFIHQHPMPWAEVALRFNINSDARLWGIFKCLRTAGFVETCSKFGRAVPEAEKVTSRWFSYQRFLDAHTEHPLILRLIADPTAPGLLEELREAFPVREW